MKTRNIALALTIAAMLPTIAHADAISDSFERDMKHEKVVSAFAGTTDPVAELINTALSGSSDTVLASFERDMNHDPVVSTDTMNTGTIDPVAALNGSSDPVLASFERDMNRDG
jgi:hypothetical protein